LTTFLLIVQITITQ